MLSESSQERYPYHTKTQAIQRIKHGAAESLV
jgi:hypothetical protein